MPSISLPVAALAAAGISAAGSLGGAAISAHGASKAADTQLAMFNTINGQEAPFRTFGQNQLGPLGNLLSGNPAQVNAQLEQMPGYQFALTQGLKSVQNGATARGLGVSGAAQKAAASYATGLASQTYQNQVQNLLAGATLGQDAAAQTGVAGTALAGNAGGFQAGAAGALGAGFQGAASSFATPYYMNAFGGGSGYGVPGTGPGVGFGSGAGDLSFDPAAANYFPA